MSKFYLPILKSKLGELSALRYLSNAVKERVFPLFEITPMEWDNESQEKSQLISDHIAKFIKKFKRCWSRPAFVDDSLIDSFNDDDFDSYVFIASLLLAENVNIIPVIRMAEGMNTIRRIARLKEHIPLTSICIRVSIEDSIADDFDASIKAFIFNLGIDLKDIHFVLDLGNANFSNQNRFASMVIRFLNSLEQLRSFKSVTLVGADFPPTGNIKSGNTYIDRAFLSFYRTVSAHFAEKLFTINYGDYGVVSPEYFEFDPTKMSRSAIIRYTIGSQWYVAKGTKLKDSSTYLQYHELADRIRLLPEYSGDSFSHADRLISQCALRQKGPGNPTTWSTVGFNHHFTKVYSELFASLRD
ncbi:beta family protein [Nostocales cyanobacterium LEGE 12452]|nr:beta family protein [Nostocales cyanobacterium LEGE 12452]